MNIKELIAKYDPNKIYGDAIGSITLDTTHFNKEDGLTPKDDAPLSEYYTLGNRGEGIYLLKTAYTDIKIDGELDPAYTYGVHVRGDVCHAPELYGDVPPSFLDAYLVRGQDGRIYVYVDVTDSEVVVDDYFFNGGGAPHHADGIDFFYEVGNSGTYCEHFAAVADPTGKYKYGVPHDYVVKITDKGYAVEFAIDNHGKPFVESDEVAFGVYLNDAICWNAESKNYKRLKVKIASALVPRSMGYRGPAEDCVDAVRVTLKSVSGRVGLEEKKHELCGDVLTDIFRNNASTAVIYGKCTTAQTIIEARRITELLRGAGVAAELYCEDKIKDGKSYECEILVGVTERPESRKLFEALEIGEYGVSIGSGSLSMMGWLDSDVHKAGELLLSILAYGDQTGSAKGLETLYKGEREIPRDNVPKLRDIDSVSDVGKGAYQLYRLNATVNDYQEYLSQLESSGFTLHTTNKIADALFATYYDGNTVVNAQYGGAGDRSLRIVAEPREATALPMLEPPTLGNKLASCSVTVTDYIHSGSMCLIFRLSNGHFVIVDGDCNGMNGQIYDTLRSMAPDGHPVIESWIITHFHGDHMGGFIDYLECDEYMKNTTVESVIYNMPAQQVIDLASFSTHDMLNISKLYVLLDGLKDKGTVVYRARTGQKYYFGDSVIEMLWTYEDIMPFNLFADRSNPTSIGFTVELGGQRVMVTGDSSGEEFTMAYKKFGNALKSDIVQLSHHGQGDGYSPIEFYRTVAAPYVINPGIGDYYGIGEAWARDNCERYLMRLPLGRFTVPLPYDGGEVESTRGN